MKNKFELPYNFQKDYFFYLEKCKDKFDLIDCIYLPAFKEDNIKNTREETIGHILPETIEEYEGHIKKIQSYNIPINILIQKSATLEIVNKYINKYDIGDFTLNDDKLAKTLKDIYKNKIRLRLSITRMLIGTDFYNQDLSMYDDIILFFGGNKHLDGIKKLPKTHKYSIIPNTFCRYDCIYCKQHGFEGKSHCAEELASGKPRDKSKKALIKPNELSEYNDYIDVYKLEDRSGPSFLIFNIFKEYVQ